MKRVILTFIVCGLFFFAEAGNSTLYPNPANTEFTIQAKPGKALKDVSVYNYLGVKVATTFDHTFGNSITANISAIKQGKYFVNVLYTDGTRAVLQLV